MVSRNLIELNGCPAGIIRAADNLQVVLRDFVKGTRLKSSER